MEDLPILLSCQFEPPWIEALYLTATEAENLALSVAFNQLSAHRASGHVQRSPFIPPTILQGAAE